MEQMQTVEQVQELEKMEEQTMEQVQVTTQEIKEEAVVTSDGLEKEVSSQDMETTSEEKDETFVIKEHYAELLEENEYVLNMHIVSDAKSRRSKGCKFYLTKKGSNIPLITGEEEISISCRKLLQAKDHNVMGIIFDLDARFTEDNLKKAFDRAKKCIESTQARMGESNSLTIDEAYSVLMQDAVTMAEEEVQQMKQEQQSETESITEKAKTRAFKYDKEHKTIMISKNRFRQMLEDLDCGFTATTFCKKLAILENHMGIRILQRNNGRCGYDYATADMGRVYKFKIVDLQHFACE